MLCMFQNIL